MDGLNNRWNGKADFDESIECRFCSHTDTSLLTAKHLLTTSNWEFYYCFNCKNWFKTSERNQGEARLVRDAKLVTALEYFTQASEMFQPIEKKKMNGRSVVNRITFAIYDLISPYLSED
jgi:hypothetical protein